MTAPAEPGEEATRKQKKKKKKSKNASRKEKKSEAQLTVEPLDNAKSSTPEFHTLDEQSAFDAV